MKISTESEVQVDIDKAILPDVSEYMDVPATVSVEGASVSAEIQIS